ncbi:uncharacterized protein Prosap isoform X2 [Chelonus insularis]|uniref:uncharacterized protein Prosap isoform X2 n=1 Tax=Chelonus insularis TaxID=460826 RepID=UPI00158ACC21|nr:uncharacterized protein LOC118063885 isoform X2 [Chelonus insularis]
MESSVVKNIESFTNNESPQQTSDSYKIGTEIITSGRESLLMRIHVPELSISKCLQFAKDQLIWDAKQQCLSSLPKELEESFNYGLFCPPMNGKAGKFLEEERPIGDYTFDHPIGYLELKYKRRVYKMFHVDEKQLKSLHTRTNLRRLYDYITNNQVEKITKLCNKGLDPNFHSYDNGETPLSFAATLKKSSQVIISLVNGGAILDYRTKEGLTALHRAVEKNNFEAVKTLLELGASPNYKDLKGLTPLYYSVIHQTDPRICEILLNYHATIGSQDCQGWQEIHQACRNNLVQHLDHLLFYGADLNAQNASGNTPLHVCAVNNTNASCIQRLLFQGAQKNSLNYANQTPYQVAVIAGNMDLAEIIASYNCGEIEENYNDSQTKIKGDKSKNEILRSEITKSISRPGTTVICTETYNSSIAGHLNLNQGDILEVIGATDCGLLEGVQHGHKTGLFPARCVQQIKQRHSNVSLSTQFIDSNASMWTDQNDIPCESLVTVPKLKHMMTSEPKTVVLHRSKRGFGFILRGAKSMSSNLTSAAPAAQYLDDVTSGGVADLAGLRKGDFLIEINGEDISAASHEHVVELIRNSGELVKMTVITPMNNLPYSYSSMTLPTSHFNQPQYATLPRKSSCWNIPTINTLGRLPAPMPPRRDPRTTLSVGRARARSMVAGLEMDAGRTDDNTRNEDKFTSAESLHASQQTFKSSRLPFPENYLCGSPLNKYYCSALDLKIEVESVFSTGRNFHSQGDISILSTKKNTALPNFPDPLLSCKQSAEEYNEMNDLSNMMNKTSYIRNLIELCRGKHGMKSSIRPLNIAKLYPQLENLKTEKFYAKNLLRNRLQESSAIVSELETSNSMFRNASKRFQKGILLGNHENTKKPIDKCNLFTTAITITTTNTAITTTSITTNTTKTVPFCSESINKVENENNNKYINNSISGSCSDCSSSSSSSSGSRSSSSGNSRRRSRRSSSCSSDSCQNSSNKCRESNNNNKKSIKNIRVYKDDGMYHHNNHNIVGSLQAMSHVSHDLDLIPEPDYSISESDNEEKEDINASKSEVNECVRNTTASVEKQKFTEEISDNFNKVGVKFLGDETSPFPSEVQEQYDTKMPSEPAKIYPNKLINNQSSKIKEVVDNISSNFCSDQNAFMKGLIRIDNSTKIINNEDNIKKDDHHLEKLTQINNIFSRYDVGLSQLPPPIEIDMEEHYNNLFVPPPPEFNVSIAFSNKDNDIVLPLPPPQFRDNKQLFQQNLVKSNELHS